MRIFDWRIARFALSEQRNVVHRAGTIERDKRDDVFKLGRLYRRQRAAHPFGFELEHADRVTALHQIINTVVVPRQRIEIDGHAAQLQKIDSLPQHAERFETEEVELHQSRILDMLHVELRHRHV